MVKKFYALAGFLLMGMTFAFILNGTFDPRPVLAISPIIAWAIALWAIMQPAKRRDDN